MHTIESMPEKSDVPSNFTLKLRKHIRSRRLEDVKQLGCDRVVQLTFGSGDTEVKLLLEFYASGNVILVDNKYRVLTLLRSHRDDAKGMATMAQHVYPIQTIRLRTATPVETVHEAVAGGMEGSLKDLMSRILAYGPQVAGFCIRRAGLNPKRDVFKEPLSTEEESLLMQAIREFEKWVDVCEDKAPEGCIMVDKKGQYNDFQPLVNGSPIVEQPLMEMKTFPTFDDAVNEFFSKIQGDRQKSQIEQQEDAAKKKLESIRADHAQRIHNLNHDVVLAEQKATVLQCNLHKVDAAIDSVREALAAGINWTTLDEMITSEKDAGNPVASLIHSLKLDKNTIVVTLDDLDSDRQIHINVDLSLTAHANVAAYYELKKKYADKAKRTLESNDKALAAAESKILIKLQKIQQQSSKSAAGDRTRKPYWFEKFHWFISSENYLVVSGRDAQQNELLVKRYLRKGDIYVHAELHGASSTIIKNNDPSKPIPLMTLSEAGQACVARSAAWDAKVVTSAYWVYPDQVSKTAPSGEYLTTGSMMIRGRKNFLPSQPLVMGIGWLFKLEEGSVASHLGERAPRSLVLDDQRASRIIDDTVEKEQNTNKNSKPTALEAFLDSSLQQTEQYTITSSGKPAKPKKPQATKQPIVHNKQEEEEEESQGPKRGSKSKKAMKKKYKDQDEEERQLAMSLLQSDGKKKPKDKKARRAERKAKMAARKAQASGIKNPEITQDDIENLTARLELDNVDEQDKSSSSTGRGPSQSTSKSSSISEDPADDSERIEELMKEEGIEVLKDEDAEKLTPILDELTGLPRPSDTILAALPVCAPYQTVSSYKYHIKLVPGTQKKGKAYKQAIDVIKARMKSTQTNDSTEKEVEMIKAISDKEGIEAMVGNVKLQVAGLQKLQQKQKMAKKNKKKNP